MADIKIEYNEAPDGIPFDVATFGGRAELLESGEWLNVQCNCGYWTICLNHRIMADRLGIKPVELIDIIIEIQEVNKD